jgi:hypothetical protein
MFPAAQPGDNGRSVFHRLFLALGLTGLACLAPPLQAQLRSDVDALSLGLPAVGSSSLRILSPVLLEVTVISASADGEPNPPDLRVTVDGRDAAVASLGAKRRVAYAPLARDDLRIATLYYIQLAQELVPASRARVTASPPGSPPIDASAAFDPLRENPALHVNQEGYVPSLPKKALVGYYLGDMGEMAIPASAGFSIIGARDGKPVFTGALSRRPDAGFRTSPTPYQSVYEADFSAFTTPGEYRLVVPGLGASLPFLVDDGIAMAFARTYALGLYGQRCGGTNELPFTRFVHGACHDAPAEVPVQSDPRFAFTWATIAGYAGAHGRDNPPQVAPALTSEAAQLYPFVRRGTVDVSGGHHDAGDYSKYTINSAELIHYLVFTADSVTGAAALDNLGIPESGDGIPDLLQEAKWEADYLSKLQDSDGGFYFLVYPRDRQYESNVLPDHGDPQVVWPKNTAATAAAVAALAQCASSPAFKRSFPEAAARYLGQARLGWDFLTRAIAAHGNAGAYQKITFYGDRFTHDDELAWAACELFLATGEPAFQEKLNEWFPDPGDPATFRWGWCRMADSWGNAVRSYTFAARSGRLRADQLDPRYLRLCEDQVIAAADDVLRWSGDSAYATPFPTKTKAVRGGGWYFSLDQASDMAVAYCLAPRPEYLDALVGAMNYEGGCNPSNVTFLTGLGVRRQREIVDQYAQNDRRVLPPSGIPLGNIQAAFQFMPRYGNALRAATYPDDNAPQAPYPIYDRWSDAFNVTTEFIAVNQARGLLAAALLASQSGAAPGPWKGARAEISQVASTVRPGSPPTLRVDVPGLDLSRARVVWESRAGEPAFGRTYTLSARASGPTWVEVEAEWPDGRRAIGSTTLTVHAAAVSWVNGRVPDGGSPVSSGGDGWAWVVADPVPRSGVPGHQSTLSAGLHEHGFNGATDTLSVMPGDSLFAWVYLDPANPPAEIMLSWNDGSPEHRAYWGSNAITYGQSGSPGRFHAGPIPEAGRWIQLRVPAQAVALEGSTLGGMGFSLMGGRATWGEAGRQAARAPSRSDGP